MEYIKIPTDFKSLHDLKELTDNFNLMTNLHNALNNYQEAYVNSFLMSFNDLLSLIPEENLKKYNIINHTSYFQKFNLLKIINDVEELEKLFYFYLNQNKSITIKDLLNIKCFFVDHNKSKIHLCTHLFDYNSTDFNFKKSEYKINTKKQILYFKKHFNFIAYQNIGGIWINGQQQGYLSGGETKPLTLKGYITYKFCTNTNIFLGEDQIYYEKYEKWIKT